MNGIEMSQLRCLIATIDAGRASGKEDVTQLLAGELRSANFLVQRSVTVRREKEFIQQLVLNAANGDEADAVLLVGGVGIGPRDFTCEAVAELSDRQMDGFGEAYRCLLLGVGESIARAVIARATARVCDRCVVVALPRCPAATLRRAMQQLVIPMLPEAVRIARGVGPSVVPLTTERRRRSWGIA
jgi:molybdenum cofactor synthesis domain-containing protein